MRNLKLPIHQRILKWAISILGGIIALGAVLDALSNAITLVNLSVAGWGSLVLVSGWVATELGIKRFTPTWRGADGSEQRIKKLGTQPRLMILGMLLLLWFPSGLEWLKSVGMPQLLASSNHPRNTALIYEPFAEALVEWQDQLGPPQPPRNANIRFHEFGNAYVIWAEAPSKRFYVLRKQPQVFRINDDPAQRDEGFWESTQWLRKNVMACPGELPPCGGVGKMMKSQRSEWEWIGCLLWDDWVGQSLGRMQKFASGIIVGPVAAGKERKNEWISIVLLHDKSQHDESQLHGRWQYAPVATRIERPQIPPTPRCGAVP